MDGSNIILTGMPGVGKSTAGVVLAKIIGYGFLDADLLIQEKEGRLLKDIIEKEGVDGFIGIEERVNASIAAKNTVIATGGSAVYGRAAMEHFKEIGTIVYLKLGFKPLSKRLGDLKGRGVVLREGQTLEDIFIERSPLYEKYADIVIDEEGASIERTVQMILEALRRTGRA